MIEKDIICVCEVAQDIDDLIGVEFLNRSERLKGVVLDPPPKTKEDWERVQQIKEMGIEIFKSIPPCKAIFIGGAFTSTARYLILNKVDLIVANGGFVGANIVSRDKQLRKFKDRTHVRTFNFCMDVMSTMRVLQSKNFNRMLLVGKNVCHDARNTVSGIWKEDWIKKYEVSESKRLHDLLAYAEGLDFMDSKSSKRLEYIQVIPEAQNINGNQTKFGSVPSESSNIWAATMWRND